MLHVSCPLLVPPARTLAAVGRWTALLAVVLLLVAPAAPAQTAASRAGTNTVTVLGPSDALGAGGGVYPLALGGTGDARIIETAADAAGNTYVVGDFTGAIDFDPGPGQVIGISSGASDVFGASYGPGGAFRWAFSYGSNLLGEVGSGVAVADGRVFFGGIFYGTVNFGGAAGSVTSNGDGDGLVLAVDAASGAFLWASSFGGALADGNPRLAASGGRVFVDARFIGPADFDDGPGQTILTGSDSYDAALASYSASTGALQWARSIFGGTGQQFEGGVDTDGSTVYATASSFSNRNGLVGGYQAATGATVFETPTTGLSPYDVALEGTRLFVAGAALPNTSTSDVWVAAYTTAGAQIWANTLTGPGLDVAQSVDAIGGRVFLGGGFEQTVDFDPGAGTASRTSAGDADAFVALYAAADGAFLQAEALGGPGFDQAYTVEGGATRGFVAGLFSGTAELDPTPGRTTTRTSEGGFDAFLSVYFPDGASFVVTSTADAGAGSLRDALVSAASFGGGTVSFAIPGPGPHTLAPASPLPFLTETMVVDGFSQPGAQPNTAAPWQPSNAVHAVVLSGANVGATGNGLVVRGDNSVVRGLAVVGFPWHGVLLESAGSAVEGCVIGTDDAGTAGLGNGFSGIWANGSANTRIGGPDAAQRNVISGNANFGVLVYGAGASGTVVQGNFIGTNPAGTAAVANSFSGIYTGSNAPFNDPSPSEARDVQVGGSAPGAGNLVSGNAFFGVEVQGRNQAAPSDLGATRVEGNRIGTNAAGTAAVANRRAGAITRNNPTGVTIGGATPAHGNVLSGNLIQGLNVEVSADILVQNNLVGVTADATAMLGNGQTGIGMFCSTRTVVRGNVVGGTPAGGIGASCQTAGAANVDTRIVGNWIGTDRSGTRNLGNPGAGIIVSRNGSGLVIGGDDPADANTIAFNNGPGVLIRANLTGSADVRRNTMYSNTALGIDLEPAGRAANDPGDADAGANRQQNHPALASATGMGGTLTLSYTVDTAAANATYPLTVDVYIADADNEEGRTWVGRHTYTTPQAPVVAALASAVDIPDGARLVATARDAAGNTSEFSDPVPLSGAIVDAQGAPAPAALALAAYPNPTRGSASVVLGVSAAGPATVEVFDALGRRVAVLHSGDLAAGVYPLALDGSRLPAGVYVVRATSGAAAVVQQLTVVR